MITTRKANFYDLPTLYQLHKLLRAEEESKWMLGEEPYPWHPRDDSDMAAFAIERLPLLAQELVNYLVAEKDGQIVGFVLSSINKRPVGAPAVSLFVHELYVLPGERTGEPERAAKLLTEALRPFAQAHGASTVELSCIGAVEQVKFWSERGYKPYKIFMQKELK